jgi:hypothetical protein
MFVIKQNDTLPVLQAQLFDHNKGPLNLDLCGVRFHMSDSRGKIKLDKPVTIVDEAQGIIQVEWLPGETDTAGTYFCEFEINMPDGRIVTVPNDGYFRIVVVAELA